jgi:hypothetical protein
MGSSLPSQVTAELLTEHSVSLPEVFFYPPGKLRANGVNWTSVFGPVVAIAKVDRTWSGAAAADFPRSDSQQHENTKQEHYKNDCQPRESCIDYRSKPLYGIICCTRPATRTC